MRTINSRTWLILILIELLAGILMGYSFIKSVIYSESILGQGYFSGIVSFYGVISLCFFIPVLTIGVISAKKLRKSHLVKRAIYSSIIFWIASLFLYAVSYSYFSYSLGLRVLPVFMLLIGIVSGFNIGLASKTTNISI